MCCLCAPCVMPSTETTWIHVSFSFTLSLSTNVVKSTFSSACRSWDGCVIIGVWAGWNFEYSVNSTPAYLQPRHSDSASSSHYRTPICSRSCPGRVPVAEALPTAHFTHTRKDGERPMHLGLNGFGGAAAHLHVSSSLHGGTLKQTVFSGLGISMFFTLFLDCTLLGTVVCPVRVCSCCETPVQILSTVSAFTYGQRCSVFRFTDKPLCFRVDVHKT